MRADLLCIVIFLQPDEFPKAYRHETRCIQLLCFQMRIHLLESAILKFFPVLYLRKPLKGEGLGDRTKRREGKAEASE
jgi:hypothetical protein